ncbi:hypothetical protein ABVT39_010349 [Epinephelus coioides]
MGPKRSEETEEIKKVLEFLTEEVSAVRLQQKSILDLVEEVKALRIQNAEKDKRFAYLECRVTDLEQYTRVNDVISTEFQVKPRSYARAVTAGRGETTTELEVSTEQQVVAFLQSKGIELDGNNIEACHPLPRRNASDRPSVIMRFANRKHKIALLKEGRKLKGTDVYINEHLTKHNTDIAKKSRYLKKHKKIQHTWTTNCKVFIKLNGSLEEANVLLSFDIIAVSETWINVEKGADFELDGYEFIHLDRQNKGGGVAFFVDKNLNFRVVENMSVVINNMLECISLEIYNGKNKNIIISCVYRTPGSNIELFQDWMEEMFSKITHKTIFICGDFNTDLLNPNRHRRIQKNRRIHQYNIQYELVPKNHQTLQNNFPRRHSNRQYLHK